MGERGGGGVDGPGGSCVRTSRVNLSPDHAVADLLDTGEIDNDRDR